MRVSPDPTTVPRAIELAQIVKMLGGTPRHYLPNSPATDESLVKAALAAAAYGRAARIACQAHQNLMSTGDEEHTALLSGLPAAAIAEGDDRIDTVPRTWYWQVANLALALRDVHERAPANDLLTAAMADTSRALMILLEAWINLSPQHTNRLTDLLGQAEENLTSARAHTTRIPHWMQERYPPT